MLRSLALALLHPCLSQAEDLLGQKVFQYRFFSGWATDPLLTDPVKNGHALAFVSKGGLYLLTDDARLSRWAAPLPNNHGMAFKHEVRKRFLDGTVPARSSGWTRGPVRLHGRSVAETRTYKLTSPQTWPQSC
jgi:hypothetical protein